MSSSCYTKKCPCQEVCPLKTAWDLVGGKWKIQLICALKMDGTTRYGELKRKINGITNTMLASSLKELERDGMVDRVQYNEIPLRVEYSITEKAETIMHTLHSLAEWGKKN